MSENSHKYRDSLRDAISLRETVMLYAHDAVSPYLKMQHAIALYEKEGDLALMLQSIKDHIDESMTMMDVLVEVLPQKREAPISTIKIHRLIEEILSGLDMLAQFELNVQDSLTLTFQESRLFTVIHNAISFFPACREEFWFETESKINIEIVGVENENAVKIIISDKRSILSDDQIDAIKNPFKRKQAFHYIKDMISSLKPLLMFGKGKLRINSDEDGCVLEITLFNQPK